MSRDFKRGGQAIRRIRKERGMTQEDFADKSGTTANTASRIERGLLIPAFPTRIDSCNAPETGADPVLAACITADTPRSLSARKLDGLDAEKQGKKATEALLRVSVVFLKICCFADARKIAHAEKAKSGEPRTGGLSLLHSCSPSSLLLFTGKRLLPRKSLAVSAS